MKKTLTILSWLSLARPIRDDDLIDQLHHFVTTSAFLGLASLFSVKKFFVYIRGVPAVACWMPGEYGGKRYRYYAYNYCWVTGFYNVPFDEEIPVGVEDRYTEDRSVLYYRWIVIIFLLQALMFKLPNLLWQRLKSSSGIDITEILKMTLDIHLVSEEKRAEKLNTICDFMVRWLKMYRCNQNARTSKTSRFGARLGRKSGYYLSCLRLAIKVLYFINVIVQFKLLASILGFDYWMYGKDVFRMVATKYYFEDAHHFPRVALCDFELRQLQNIQRFTVQCSLSFNVFVEKVFAAEWFVLAGLCILTAVHLITCVVGHVYSRQRGFIQKYARLMNLQDCASRKLFMIFVRNYLMADGVYVITIISNNSSEVLAVELLQMLWKRMYREIEDIGTQCSSA